MEELGWVIVKSKKVATVSTRIYNDYNPLLANVFECFRQNPSKVLAAMNRVEKSNFITFKSYQKELFSTLNWNQIELGDVDLAVKYLYLQTQVFAGTPLTSRNAPYFTETKAEGKYPSKYETLKKKLANLEIIKRLTEITAVEKLDCIDLIQKYDSKNTFFYLDPPYYNTESYYSREFPREKHRELAITLQDIKGKFALSYYDFNDSNGFTLRQLYPEDRFAWFRQNVYRSSATRHGKEKDYKEKSKGTEILIMNYENR